VFKWGLVGCAGVMVFSVILVFVFGAALFASRLGDPSGWLSGGGGTGSLVYPAGVNPEEIGPRLDEYMRNQVSSSPLVGKGLIFAQAGKQWNINPALMIAIAQQESQLGTAGGGPPKKNPFGWGCPPCISFSSWDEAISQVTENMRKNYLNEGKITIEQIGNKWAPVGASNDPNNLNSSWITRVTQFFNAIISYCPQLAPAPISGGNIISIAQGEIGICETGNNCGPVVKYGGTCGDAWCAYFVSWVYTKAGYLINIGGAENMKQFFTNNHRFIPKGTAPTPGNVMFINLDTDSGADHVGIVEEVVNDRVNYIAGNNLQGCVGRSSKTLNDSQIMGYGRW